jgi:predicted metal-dependent hydrolase
MICFCAGRFQWLRMWQNPGELLPPGLSDMATRALLYRRPAEPSTLLVKHGSQIYSIRVRRHRRARRYTLRIHPTDREAILTMPPRGTIAEAKDFARLHGGWIAARLGRLPKAAPFLSGTVVPLRGVPHRIVHRNGERGTVWTETRDSGEKVLCVAGGAEHMERRVHDYLKREARKDLQKASLAYAEELGVRVKRVSIRDQSSRWGSCTSAGSVSFSWRLVLAPPFVLDYLAAHEVAHLVEMNHSARFWRVVAKVCPSVERAKTWLDTHGNDLHRYGIQD